MARALALLAFAVVVVLPLVPAPAAATSVAPGWNVFLGGDVVFAGDPVNITVKGVAGNFTVEVRITDPNGTLDRSYFPRYRNTIATYNYTTKFSDASGDWTVGVYIEGNQVAYSAYELRWDELNFLSKRITLLEKQNTQQGAMIRQNAEEIRELRSQIIWFLIAGIATFTATALIGFWVGRVVGWPLYCFLKALDLEIERRDDNPWTRLMNWLANPLPASFLAAFHERRRSKPSPKWVAESMAFRSRHYAANHGVTFPADPPKGPVKKVKVKRPSTGGA